MSKGREIDPGLQDARQTSLETTMDSSLPVSFGYKIRRIQIAYSRHFAQHTNAGDIPVNQLGALSLVVRNPGITPKDLAVLLNRDAGQLSPILKHLDAKDLIERKKCASDSRSHSLYATAKGILEYRRLQVIITATEETFLGDVLQADERQQLLDLLDRLETASRGRAFAPRPKGG